MVCQRTEESTLQVDSLVPLMHHDLFSRETKIHFRIISDLKTQSRIFLKKHTPSVNIFHIQGSKLTFSFGSQLATNRKILVANLFYTCI